MDSILLAIQKIRTRIDESEEKLKAREFESAERYEVYFLIADELSWFVD